MIFNHYSLEKHLINQHLSRCTCINEVGGRLHQWKFRVTDAGPPDAILGCVYIQKCLWSSCHHSTAKRHENHGQNHFYIVRILHRLFCTHKKPFSLYPMFSSLFSFKNTKKLKGKFLMRAKRTIKKFNQMKVILPMKFMSLGCIMVIIWSETLLYVNTPQ